MPIGRKWIGHVIKYGHSIPTALLLQIPFPLTALYPSRRTPTYVLCRISCFQKKQHCGMILQKINLCLWCHLKKIYCFFFIHFIFYIIYFNHFWVVTSVTSAWAMTSPWNNWAWLCSAACADREVSASSALHSGSATRAGEAFGSGSPRPREGLSGRGSDVEVIGHHHEITGDYVGSTAIPCRTMNLGLKSS